MISRANEARLIEWQKSLDPDTRLGLKLIAIAFDKWLDSFEHDTYDKETAEMFKLFAARRYNVGQDGGLALMFSAFADGFLSGLEIGEKV